MWPKFGLRQPCIFKSVQIDDQCDGWAEHKWQLTWISMYSWALNEVKNKASKYTSTREKGERERLFILSFDLDFKLIYGLVFLDGLTAWWNLFTFRHSESKSLSSYCCHIQTFKDICYEPLSNLSDINSQVNIKL